MEIPEFLSQKKIVLGKFGQKVPLFVLSFPLDDAFVVCVFHKNEKKGEANIFVWKKHHSCLVIFGFYPLP